MDGERFDALARSLGKGLNRRQALKALFGGTMAAATTAALKHDVSAAGYGEVCGGTIPQDVVIECDSGLTCCAIASDHGICLTTEQCNNPALIACTTSAQCPGNFVCCPDGFCSSDLFGDNCPTITTTPAPPTTTTTEPPTTTTAVPTTTTPLPGSNTGTGSNVVVMPGSGSTIIFSTVTAPGQTSVTPVSFASLPALPDSSIYQNANGEWYEISTTATSSGPIQVCLPSDDPSDRLLHYVSGAWVDVTSAGSPSGGTICGVVNSLSPFAVVPLIDWADDDDDDDDADDDDGHHYGGDHGYGGKQPHSQKGGGTGSVDTLPSTGSGPATNDVARLGLTLAASAAAVAAARALRTEAPQTGER